MARGASRERMNEINQKTRFDGERAVQASAKSHEAARQRAEIKPALKSLAALTLYNSRVLPDKARKAVARRVGCDESDVTPALAAVLRQVDLAVLGDLHALEFLRDQLGERPRETALVEVSQAPTDAEIRAMLDKLTDEQLAQYETLCRIMRGDDT